MRLPRPRIAQHPDAWSCAGAPAIRATPTACRRARRPPRTSRTRGRAADAAACESRSTLGLSGLDERSPRRRWPCRDARGDHRAARTATRTRRHWPWSTGREVPGHRRLIACRTAMKPRADHRPRLPIAVARSTPDQRRLADDAARSPGRRRMRARRAPPSAASRSSTNTSESAPRPMPPARPGSPPRSRSCSAGGPGRDRRTCDRSDGARTARCALGATAAPTLPLRRVGSMTRALQASHARHRAYRWNARDRARSAAES